MTKMQLIGQWSPPALAEDPRYDQAVKNLANLETRRERVASELATLNVRELPNQAMALADDPEHSFDSEAIEELERRRHRLEREQTAIAEAIGEATARRGKARDLVAGEASREAKCICEQHMREAEAGLLRFAESVRRAVQVADTLKSSGLATAEAGSISVIRTVCERFTNGGVSAWRTARSLEDTNFFSIGVADKIATAMRR